jgi:hypothetical protein
MARDRNQALAAGHLSGWRAAERLADPRFVATGVAPSVTLQVVEVSLHG